MNDTKIIDPMETDLECVSNYRYEKQRGYVSFFQNMKIRLLIGVILLVSSFILASIFCQEPIGVGLIVVIIVCVWMPSIFITHKYIHKYPSKYFTYLIASHTKSLVIMAILLAVISMLGAAIISSSKVLWIGLAIFAVVDAVVSIPRRLAIPNSTSVSPLADSKERECNKMERSLDTKENTLSTINKKSIVLQIEDCLDRDFFDFVNKSLPDSDSGIDRTIVVNDLSETSYYNQKSSPVALLCCCTRMNDIRRLNKFLANCTDKISMGGYLAIRYTPYENIVARMKSRHTLLYWPIFLLHFLWFRAVPKIPFLDTLYFSSANLWLDNFLLAIIKRRNRVLPKAEMWGRLAFYGMEVVSESEGDDMVNVVARRTSHPVPNKKPSYHMVVGLQKVGLGGKVMRLHKIRSMYPFSEFLQKRLFDDNGLNATGKFQSDFRLTDYGKFIRKYWLDEIPQIFDWLRGDIKLVGMRATSPHFLSLYPKELYELYIQIKPGLIPPIFDETTDGFDRIVAIEYEYLRRYMESPIRTDIYYFYKTFSDIVFRGVRSK